MAEKVRIMGALEKGLDHVDMLLAQGQTDLELDFGACNFISVDGLEWLEELLLRAESHKAQVRFVNLQPPQYKVLKVAHIDSLMRACGAPGNAASAPMC
ncbi:MAG: STAS domain-containing protein [Cyanobacteria bacterium SZAS LIN-2]|nr:STAS domain-containing protein [Cyanobacteria bacterium SZAS LIN-3]MBS1995088.1 STAS domain-containing protein [Cyanobacteria bacterium SZAS LIN-2]MBS2010197.1 STAS domain-containing protein [Cyanobacteria bacterium SZAS TMP-1]